MALVLNSLTAAPYEPLKGAEERFLAHKTLSAKRVGELHALSHRVSHSVGWKEVSFSFVPGFVAKTQDQSSLNPRFESFMIPALPKSRDSPNGRLLCPVRAVKYYLARTAQHRLRCERLFVASGHTKKEISKNTVSFWLRQVISLAYQLSGKPLPTSSPLARETRGIAPSLLFKKNYAVSQVLFKKGSKDDPGNYRPISLTSVPGKMLESIIADDMMSHLEHNKLILDSQHGFRSGRSCLTNLVDFFHDMFSIYDKSRAVDMLYLDFLRCLLGWTSKSLRHLSHCNS